MSTKINNLLSMGNYKNLGIIQTEYSPYAMNQVRSLQKVGIQDQAISRRYEEGITIDGISSRDLDDGIWAERTKTWYSVFVHISDVTEAIPIYSPLDLEALRRTTSIYKKDEILNMYPIELAYDMLSLVDNSRRLTMTMRVDLDDQWNISDYSLYESIFKNIYRHDYDSFMSWYTNPDSPDHTNFQLMYDIAKKRRFIRSNAGAIIDYDESDRKINIWKNTYESIDNKKIPSIIIEEFMILVNIASATIATKNNLDSIYRVHNSQAESAFYTSKRAKHTWLALDDYTHFTSPIRRYSDGVVHRVLKQVYLRWEENPYKISDIDQICKHINVKKTVIDILQHSKGSDFTAIDKITKLGCLYTLNSRQEIKDSISKWLKIPDTILDEIIYDLKSWDKINWSWAIGIFLISNNTRLKNELREILLDNTRFTTKALISLLSQTKVYLGDNPLFRFETKETSRSYKIVVYYEWKELVHYEKSYPKKLKGRIYNYHKYQNWDEKEYWDILSSAWYTKKIVRDQIVKKIITHFCWK